MICKVSLVFGSIGISHLLLESWAPKFLAGEKEEGKRAGRCTKIEGSGAPGFWSRKEPPLCFCKTAGWWFYFFKLFTSACGRFPWNDEYFSNGLVQPALFCGSVDVGHADRWSVDVGKDGKSPVRPVAVEFRWQSSHCCQAVDLDMIDTRQWYEIWYFFAIKFATAKGNVNWWNWFDEMLEKRSRASARMLEKSILIWTNRRTRFWNDFLSKIQVILQVMTFKHFIPHSWEVTYIT